jgi:hypothetical protein
MRKLNSRHCLFRRSSRTRTGIRQNISDETGLCSTFDELHGATSLHTLLDIRTISTPQATRRSIWLIKIAALSHLAVDQISP